MQILGPHHTSTESESAFDQDHEVICMHTQAPESLPRSFSCPPTETTGLQEPKGQQEHN